jgi:hypothetical protein
MIPDRDPRLRLSEPWKIVAVFLTVTLPILGMEWDMFDDSGKSGFVLMCAFAAFLWFVWISGEFGQD